MTTIHTLTTHLVIPVPENHACYAGHFPGNPLVPGALLLKWIFTAIEQNLLCQIVFIKQIKFLTIVKPGDELKIQVDRQDKSTQLSIMVTVASAPIIKGNLECVYV